MLQHVLDHKGSSSGSFLQCTVKSSLMMDPLWSKICWSNFKYFIIILIVSMNYIFVHLLANKVFYFMPVGTTLPLIHSNYAGSGAQPDFYPVVTKAPCHRYQTDKNECIIKLIVNISTTIFIYFIYFIYRCMYK